MYWRVAKEIYDQKIFLFLTLLVMLFSQTEPCDIFKRREHEGPFCEVILILDQWFRRFHLKNFLI